VARRGPHHPSPAAESPLLRLLADIGAVVALATAALYYFGWVRTKEQARVLGFDAAAMSLGTTDYILKSLNVLFVPIIVLVLAALALHTAHQRLVRPRLVPARRASVSRASRLLGWAWVPLLMAAIALAATPVGAHAVPPALTLGVLCALYGRALRREATGADPWPQATKIIVLVLLGLGTFWTTERIARVTGSAYGADFAARLDQLAMVDVYSAQDLQIDGRGVTETKLPEPDSAYHYRYTGLWLLERTGDRYFLLTAHRGRVVVLREGEGVRLEYSRPGQ
jgi:hypothetical protein